MRISWFFRKTRMLTAILLIAFSFANPIICQLPHYSFRYYTNKVGFDGLKVNSIFQDNDGFIWIGASNGLYQFDGLHFINYNNQFTFPDNANNKSIIAISEIRDGFVIAATEFNGLL